MTRLRKTILVAAVMTGLGGCSTIDKITGQTDNTVLPGQREEAIPGRNQFPENSEAAQAPQPIEPAPVEVAPACQPDDPDCQPAPGDDTFSDPQ